MGENNSLKSNSRADFTEPWETRPQKSSNKWHRDSYQRRKPEGHEQHIAAQ